MQHGDSPQGLGQSAGSSGWDVMEPGGAGEGLGRSLPLLLIGTQRSHGKKMGLMEVRPGTTMQMEHCLHLVNVPLVFMIVPGYESE